MSRKTLCQALSFSALLLTMSSVQADHAARQSHLQTLYTGSSAGQWEQVQDDKLWYREPENTNTQIFARVKQASGTFVLGTSDPNGAWNQFSIFGAIIGAQGANSTNPSALSAFSTTITSQGNRFGNAEGGAMQVSGFQSDPWSWDVWGLDDGLSNNTITSGKLVNTLTFDNNRRFRSMTDGSQNYMVAYRYNGSINGSEWAYNRYVLMWALPDFNSESVNDNSNYQGLVLDVTGVRNPEPTSMALMGLGIAGLAGYGARWMRRRKGTAVEAETAAAA